MLDKSPKESVRRHQTVAREIHMDFASSCTHANGVWLRAWRIALSITSGRNPNAALPSHPSSEMCASRKLPSSMQWHRSRGPAQVHYESREVKVPSCWDRDKSSVDPLCRPLSLNVKFHFLHKETTSLRPQKSDTKILFSENMFI
jgi:hypothetical protein